MSGHERELAHAESLIDLGRYAEAEQRLRDVLASNPDSYHALLTLGRAIDLQGRYSEAEQPVRRAIALEPEDAGGYHQLTDVLIHLKDGDGALTAAGTGRRLAPHAFVSHYQHARALLALRMPRSRDAYDSAVRAVNLAPHDPDGHNMVGICLNALGNKVGAELAFRKALELDPNHTIAQNNLAATHLDRGNLRRAAGMLKAAVSQAPQERLLHDNLDLVLLNLGRRGLWSLLAAIVVLSMLLVSEAPWWTRASSGTVYVLVVALLVSRMGSQLPRGVSRWGRGIWKRVSWRGKYLIGLLAVSSVGLLTMALAPYSVAAATGLALVTLLRLLFVISVGCWLLLAVINLVRGR